jgi:beta-glucosidase
MGRKRVALIVLIAFLSYPLAGSKAVETPPYRDPTRPVTERVQDLLSRMTLEEKVAQLHEQPKAALKIENGRVTGDSLDEVFRGLSYGTISGPFGAPAETIALINRDAQAYARSRTRLGIPFLTVNETLHGGLSIGTTIYPQTIAQGSTWNPDLIREMASAIAAEIRACGVVQALAPMLDLARDPRWGRVEECFGECPYLVSRFTVAYIQGMQGTEPGNRLPPDKLLCMSKVMAGYCVPRSGLNIASASLGERELRSIFLIPHEAAVKEAHVAAVMPSYNSIDGMPAHANRWLLTDVLRGEWGFDGYTYSDWGGVEFNSSLHGVAADFKDAARIALWAGVDLEAPGPKCFRHLPELVRAGKLDGKVIDQAVSRILRAKFRAGLFDEQGGPPAIEELAPRLHTPSMVSLARKVAEESVILLKNEGDLLPVDPGALRSVAVIGPNADQVQFGDYSATKDNSKGVTVLQAVREWSRERGFQVGYSRGCDWVGSDRSGFDDAVGLAKSSDLSIVVVGDTSMNIGGGLPGGNADRSIGRLATVGEGYDRTELTLPGVQGELVKAVHDTGKPTVVILVHGRPFAVGWIKDHVAAILDAYYPGEEGGHAIVDILFGRVNPSGRLPVSVPRSAGHIPTTYDYEPADRGYYHVRGTPEKPGRDYVFSSPDPLWEFGYGLSYTRFAYSDLEVETPVVERDGEVRLSFTVSNVGNREGREVAQVYFRDVVSSVITPNRRLVRFLKVPLAAGERRRLSFRIPARELALWNRDMVRVVEPGEFKLLIGASAEDIKLEGSFQVE